MVTCPACDGTKVDLVEFGDRMEREPCGYCGGSGELENVSEKQEMVHRDLHAGGRGGREDEGSPP